MKLQTVNTNYLTTEDVHAIAKALIDTCKPYETMLDGIVKNGLAKLSTLVELMGSQLNRTQANALTKEIGRLNKECDQIWKEIKRKLNAEAQSVVDTQRAGMAEEMKIFVKPYWDVDALPNNTQINLFHELFKKYNADADVRDKMATLNLDKALALLETQNKAHAHAWNERNDIQGDIAALPAASSLKRETASTYTQVCKAMEAQYAFDPSGELKALLLDINEGRLKYATLIARRQTAKKQKTE